MTTGSGLFVKQHPRLAHLVRGQGGLKGEISDLRGDVLDTMAPLVALAVEEFINPRSDDSSGIKGAVASATTIQVYEGAALDGTVGAGTLSPPRNIKISTNSNADIDAVGVLFEGLDINGDVISETITLIDGGGSPAPGLKAFASVVRITVPAQSGGGGVLTFGFGRLLGLSQPIKSRAGLAALTLEIAIGAVVTTGTVVDAATGAPNGTYSPASAPNTANDYAIYYEYDPNP